jgi:DNA topoisomerase-3
MQLIIAEKPSVGQSLAAVLGATERKDGYLQSNGYLVSWCIGHLVGLAAAHAYDEKYSKWRQEDLPILPGEWQYIVVADKKKQFATLRELMNRKDMESLVCATDAGREGELIFRFVYEVVGCKKPFARLWISSMEESAIRQGFDSLKDGREYDALYHSALCRAKADWLIGINATRLFSVIYGKTLNVGRVQTPTLAMLTERGAKISGFTKEKYHHVHIASGDLTASSERIPDVDNAHGIQAACHERWAVCVSIETEQKTQAPPKLFDLTALQREANRLFGYTAKQTLDLAQALYEKKLLTYPRTDSRFLTSDMTQTAPVLVNLAALAVGFIRGKATVTVDNVGSVINDAKVSDHHAIIPTMSIQDFDMSTLPETERSILTLVCVRLVQRKGKQLLPTQDGHNLIAVLPDVLTSPMLTAEWENALTLIAQGAADPDAFMRDIESMAKGLCINFYKADNDKKALFRKEKEVIGTCPRCGNPVYEGKKNFYCSNRDCQFVMWKNDRFFENRKKALTKPVAAALLADGKTFDATVLLADTGGKYINYRFEQKGS